MNPLSLTARLLAPIALAAALWSLASCSSAGGWRTATTPPDPAPAPIPAEFRAAWVATVANIDWPSAKNLGRDAQLAEIDAIVERARSLHLNAIILQVRPTADAIYPSSLEPWSEFVTGASGAPPSPEYDPLQAWLDRCHAAGIELHAWINPFRARHPKSETPLAPNHIAARRPDLAKPFTDLIWLDPGEPDARAHALAVVDDLLARYPLDGVHIDDYFYPYPKQGVPFPDDASWERFGKDRFPDRAAWRRNNIDSFVKDLYTLVKSRRPHALVGVSPFGIYRPDHPPGVKGFDAYLGLNADARLWLREGWMDYVAPQLYWKVDAPQQPFLPLLRWWMGENPQNRHVWPGLYASRIEAAGGWTPDEIERQIDLIRQEHAGGSILFSMIALLQDRQSLATRLTARFGTPALVPDSPWLAGDPPARPRVTVALESETALRLTLKPGSSAPLRRWIVQIQRSTGIETHAVGGIQRSVEIPTSAADPVLAVTVRAVGESRRLSPPIFLARTQRAPDSMVPRSITTPSG